MTGHLFDKRRFAIILMMISIDFSDGIIDPIIPLKLSKYLKKEKHYIPWAMARAKLDCITMLLSDKKMKKLYKVENDFYISLFVFLFGSFIKDHFI